MAQNPAQKAIVLHTLGVRYYLCCSLFAFDVSALAAQASGLVSFKDLLEQPKGIGAVVLGTLEVQVVWKFKNQGFPGPLVWALASLMGFELCAPIW